MTQIFDRNLLAKRLARHAAHRPDAIERHVATELTDRLSLITRHFDRALLITHHPETFVEALQATGKVSTLDVMTPPEGETTGKPAASYNAIFHVLDLQAVNDVPALLTHLRSLLMPDGLLLIACFGGETLSELRQAWLTAEEHVTEIGRAHV